MNTLNQMKSMFDCKICSGLLKDPVVIPCGNTVCIAHTRDVLNNSFACKCCKQEHSVSKDGFVISKFIQKQLEIQLNLIPNNQICAEYMKQEEVKEDLDELKKFEQDSETFIYNYFEELKRQVDLRREDLKSKIENYSNDLIESINELRNKHCQLTKQENILKTKIDNSKKELNESINKFDVFNFNESDLFDIKENITEMGHKFDNLSQLRQSLIDYKEYSFNFNDQSIERIFGTFSENVIIVFIKIKK